MDTQFLESFLMAAEHGSMAESARRLNLTPAAIAQRIRALETELGVKLLTRSGRTVRPTAAGFAILERSRQFLRGARDIRSLAAGTLIAGDFRIGAVNSALTGILPDLLGALMSQHPLLEIFIKPGTSREHYPEVLEGQLDAAFIVQPRFAMPKTCVFTTLREEPLIVLAPADAAGTEALRLLRERPFIRYDRNNWGGHIADAYLKKMGLRPIERFELDSLEAIAIMVDRGLGVALVPDWAPPWPAGLRILKLAVPPPVMWRRVGVLWLRNSPGTKTIEALVKAARATAPQRAGSPGTSTRTL